MIKYNFLILCSLGLSIGAIISLFVGSRTPFNYGLTIGLTIGSFLITILSIFFKQAENDFNDE